MKAVVFKGPGKVVVEERPIPKIQDAQDIIVKVDKVLLLLGYDCAPLMLCRRPCAEGML